MIAIGIAAATVGDDAVGTAYTASGRAVRAASSSSSCAKGRGPALALIIRGVAGRNRTV